jgi:putative flippase GtrA
MKLASHFYNFLYCHIAALFKFGVVGSLTASLYFVAMWFVADFIGWSYLVAVTAAYFVSTLFHFFANRHFTFGAGSDSLRRQILRYSAMWLINYAITVLVVSFCVERVGLSPYVGVCISIAATVFLGYFLSRYWVFKSRELIS